MSKKTDFLLPNETIHRKIFVIRGKKVLQAETDRHFFDSYLCSACTVEDTTKGPGNYLRLEHSTFVLKNSVIDRHLAELYGVSSKVLNQAVKRNIERFPEDFMFRLTQDEADSSRSQFVTLKRGQNIKYLPYAFTELGVAMLSSVLNSSKAIQVNMQIMRAFHKLREMISNHEELRIKIEELEKEYDARFDRVDVHVQSVFQAFKEIKKLLKPPKSKKTKIGFITHD